MSDDKLQKMQGEIDELRRLYEALSQYDGRVKFPFDPEGIRAVEQAVDFFILAKILDYTWRGSFRYSSMFESIERFATTVPGGGAVAVNSTGLVLTTGATINNEAIANIPVTIGTKVIKFDREGRFRAVFAIDSITAPQLYIRTLEDSSGGYLALKLVNGVLKGAVSDGSTETTVDLQSVSAAEIVEGEIKYFPNDKAVFVVNGVEKGTISARYPASTASGTKRLINALCKTTDGNSKVATITSFEFIQKK